MNVEAGTFICESCRDEPGHVCDDYCAMEQVRAVSPLDPEGYPTCDCCGKLMHLLHRLVPIPD